MNSDTQLTAGTKLVRPFLLRSTNVGVKSDKEKMSELGSASGGGRGGGVGREIKIRLCFIMFCLFSLALRPNRGHGLLIFVVS